MKLLPKEFSKKGFNFREIKRKGNVAIYERSKGESVKHYEVAVIKSHQGFNLGGSFIAPSEVYPCDSQWGIYGWTLPSLEKAEEKFEDISKKHYQSNEGERDNK